MKFRLGKVIILFTLFLSGCDEWNLFSRIHSNYLDSKSPFYFIWEDIGYDAKEGLVQVEGSISTPKIAIDSSDNIYILWIKNTINKDYIYIKKWDGISWNDLGAHSSSGDGIVSINVSYHYRIDISFALDNSGNPVILYSSGSFDSKSYLIKWDGSAWVGLGGSDSSGIPSTDDSSQACMAIDNSGNPIVAWSAYNSSYYRTKIARWDGSSWSAIGTGSNSGNGITNNEDNSYACSVIIDGTGNPAVAYQVYDANYNAKIFLKRWNGSTWEELDGSATGLGVGGSNEARDANLSINENGYPVIEWFDSTVNYNSLYIKQWNGSQWEEIGEGSASGSGLAQNVSDSILVRNNSGHSLLAWSDWYYILIKEWNGSAWVTFNGSKAGCGVDKSGDFSMAVDSHNRPVVTFIDSTTDNYIIIVRRCSMSLL